jgi:Flp pilus assembly protein TadG
VLVVIRTLTERLRRGGSRLAGKFVRHSGGATTVEFALVVAPFMALLFAIMETAIVFFAGQTLETAVADSARLIMTGQVQNQSLTQDQFKANVCNKIYGLFDCANGMYVDVRTYTDFSSASTGKPIDNTGKMVNDFKFQPGGPGDIVVVRIMYQWPVFVSLLGFNLSDIAGGKRLLMATAAFRNEPYK